MSEKDKKTAFKTGHRDFPGGPAADAPSNVGGAGSRDLTCLMTNKARAEKQHKQCLQTNSIETLKMDHIKKKNLKKKVGKEK